MIIENTYPIITAEVALFMKTERRNAIDTEHIPQASAVLCGQLPQLGKEESS